MKRGKKYIKVSKDLDRNKSYSLQEGIKEVKKTSYSKFVGSLETHFDIVIPKDKDPKSIKGAISLPYSSDVKSVAIAAFVSPDKEKEAKEKRQSRFKSAKAQEKERSQYQIDDSYIDKKVKEELFFEKNSTASEFREEVKKIQSQYT